jgi:phosphoribosylformylglycinamidine synthase
MVTAQVFVTLKRGVLDPQGQAIARSLDRIGFAEVKDARIGKYIELTLDGDAPADEGARRALEARLRQMCEKLLANTVIEEFRYELIQGAIPQELRSTVRPLLGAPEGHPDERHGRARPRIEQ